MVDTGGFQLESEGMAALVSQRSLGALENAAVILLLIEVTRLTPEDEDFIEVIRRFADRVILVVNKTDNEMREGDVWEYHSLGFPRVVAISAEHGRNIDTLTKETVSMLPAETSVVEPASDEENRIHIAILGKPNTGKSTLLNRLLGFDRAIVSDIPGTTRDVIEGRFEALGREFLVLDIAGIRRKKSVHDAVEYYSVSRAISSVKRANVVFLMIDAEEGISDQDKKIADQIVKHGRGAILVFNKWDLLDVVDNTFNAVSDRTRYLFPVLDFAPIVPISAREGTGIEKLLSTALTVRKQLQIRIPTPKLNQALRGWVERHPPPYGKKRYRVKYIAQIGADPIQFALFVNNPRGFPRSWVGYVENNLRSEFNLRSVPISIELRGR